MPGLVIAESRPDLEITLVDRRATRMDALALGVVSLSWSDRVTVLTADVNDLGRDEQHAGKYAAVVSRGFGPPDVTARLARPLLTTGGVLVVSEPPEPDPSRWTAELLASCRLGPVRHLPGVAILTAV
ncbi:MAG: RsmG family class I SAM-dependent methyltransferase [Ilumatobacteraceae bacterium]